MTPEETYDARYAELNTWSKEDLICQLLGVEVQAKLLGRGLNESVRKSKARMTVRALDSKKITLERALELINE